MINGCFKFICGERKGFVKIDYLDYLIVVNNDVVMDFVYVVCIDEFFDGVFY